MAGVSVAEKRALLEAAGEEWPLCECHGEPKKWHKDARKTAGGYWACLTRVGLHRTKYNHSEKGRTSRVYRHARRVRMFGRRFVAPSMEFRALAVQIREQRRAELKHG